MVAALVRLRLAEARQGWRLEQGRAGMAAVLVLFCAGVLSVVASALTGTRDTAAAAGLIGGDAAAFTALLAAVGAMDRAAGARVRRLRAFPVAPASVWASTVLCAGVGPGVLFPASFAFVCTVRAFAMPGGAWAWAGWAVFTSTALLASLVASAVASARWDDFAAAGPARAPLLGGLGLVVLSQAVAAAGLLASGEDWRAWLPGAASLLCWWPSAVPAWSLMRAMSAALLWAGLALMLLACTRAFLLRAESHGRARAGRRPIPVGGAPWSAVAARTWFQSAAGSRARALAAVAGGMTLAWAAARFAMPWSAVAAAALLVGLGPHNSVGRDGPAFWQHPGSGVGGLPDRAGRAVLALALGAAAVPATAAAAAWGGGAPGQWVWLTAFGTVLLGSALGISAMVSVLLPYQNAADFRAGSGGSVVRELASQILAGAAAVAAALPGILILDGTPQESPQAGTLLFASAYGLSAMAAGTAAGAWLYTRRTRRLLRRAITGR